MIIIVKVIQIEVAYGTEYAHINRITDCLELEYFRFITIGDRQKRVFKKKSKKHYIILRCCFFVQIAQML